MTRFPSLFCRVSIATKHVIKNERKVNYRISLLRFFFPSILLGCFSLSLCFTSLHTSLIQRSPDFFIFSSSSIDKSIIDLVRSRRFSQQYYYYYLITHFQTRHLLHIGSFFSPSFCHRWKGIICVMNHSSTRTAHHFDQKRKNFDDSFIRLFFRPKENIMKMCAYINILVLDFLSIVF